MKELKNAREYKKTSKKGTSDCSNVTKALTFSKRLLNMFETVTHCNE
jgi:hypothetical protein